MPRTCMAPRQFRPALRPRLGSPAREDRRRGPRGADTVEIWAAAVPPRVPARRRPGRRGCLFDETWSDEEPVNIGTGFDMTIAELAQLIAGIVGFKGSFTFDPSKPDGTPRKLLDVSKLTALGWRRASPLKQDCVKPTSGIGTPVPQNIDSSSHLAGTRAYFNLSDVSTPQYA